MHEFEHAHDMHKTSYIVCRAHCAIFVSCRLKIRSRCAMLYAVIFVHNNMNYWSKERLCTYRVLILSHTHSPSGAKIGHTCAVPFRALSRARAQPPQLRVEASGLPHRPRPIPQDFLPGTLRVLARPCVIRGLFSRVRAGVSAGRACLYTCTENFVRIAPFRFRVDE